MKNHEINFDSPKVMINGKVYPILQSDVDVMESALEIQKVTENIDIANQDDIIRAIIMIRDWADKVLGKDALMKISEGMPVGLIQAMAVVTAVMDEVSESYESRVMKDYGIQPESEE